MTINIGILVLILGFMVVLPLIYIGFTGKTEDTQFFSAFSAFLVAIGAICYAVSCFHNKYAVNTDELIKFNRPASEVVKPMTASEKYDALN